MENKKRQAHELFNDARREMTEGKLDNALAHIESATKLYKEIYADDSSTLGDYYLKLAELDAYKLDRSEDAIKYYKLAADKKLASGDSKSYAYIHYVLGEIYDVDMDDLKSSAEALNIALETYIDLGNNGNLVAECFEKIASVYYRLGEYDIVKNALKKAIDIKESIAKYSKKTAEALVNAGKMSFDMRFYDDSMDYLERAYTLYAKLNGEESEEYKSAKEEWKIVRAYKGSDLH